MSEWLRRPLPFGMWLATCFAIGLLFAGGAFLYVRLQVARVDAIERLCLADNQRARDNILFIKRVSPRVAPLARTVFRVTPDCKHFAKVAANEPPPQPGTPAP